MLASRVEVAQNIGFGLIAAVMIAGAISVVTNRNVVHAALSLVMVLAGAAAQYLLLAAEFVAVTQVLVYIGAVMVLFLLGVMSWVLIDGYRGTKLPENTAPVSTATLSDSIFKPYLLPFEALSFLLLAAVIGAIVLARKD